MTQAFRKPAQYPSRRWSIPKLQIQRAARILPFRRLAPIIDPLPIEQVAQEVEAGSLLGQTRDGKQIWLCETPEKTPLLLELGRLREEAFRAVGEGTGSRCDIDEYDHHYQHLVLWDQPKQMIVGAYRLKKTAQNRNQPLYSETLFHFKAGMLPVLAAGLELGRSFIRPEYWGSRSLDYLWYGIGAYLKHNPDIRYLFGPVSISGQLPARAKALIVSFFKSHFASDNLSLADAVQPYRMPLKYRRIAHYGQDYGVELKDLQQRLKKMKVSVPTLYKQYAEVCEDGGVRFSAFNIDSAFGDCLDGLVVVDLTCLKASKRKRYFAELN
jgi:predicted GNAT family N-acyltransferase